MFKKLISMATATLVLAGGLSVVAAPSASATASSDSTLNLGLSSVKGVSISTALDSTTATAIQNPAYLNEISLSAAQLHNSSPITFVATEQTATIRVLTNADVNNLTENRFNDSQFNMDQNGSTSWVNDGDYIGVRVVAPDTTSKRYYVFKITSPADATLSSITIKGSAATLGTPSSTLSSVVPGAVTITPTVANSFASSVGVNTDLMVMSAPRMIKYSSSATQNASDFTSGPYFTTGMISDGDIIVFKALASPPTYFLYYKVVVTVGVQQQQQSNNSNSTSNAAAEVAAAEAKRQAAVVVAKSTLVETLKAGKPITASDLNAADFNVASTKAAERVAAKIATLPEAQRADLAQVQAIVKVENFVEKVSTAATQMTVTTRDLVIQELVAADYKYKTSIVKAILSKDASTLDSIEKIQAVVKAELAAIEARKARIAAVQARTLAYSKK